MSFLSSIFSRAPTPTELYFGPLQEAPQETLLTGLKRKVSSFFTQNVSNHVSNHKDNEINEAMAAGSCEKAVSLFEEDELDCALEKEDFETALEILKQQTDPMIKKSFEEKISKKAANCNPIRFNVMLKINGLESNNPSSMLFAFEPQTRPNESNLGSNYLVSTAPSSGQYERM